MVFQDLGSFQEEAPAAQENSGKSQIAPAMDRFMAFVFDLVLFSPVVSLVLSPLFKQTELRYYTAPGSLEFMAFLLIGCAATIVLCIFAQTLCLVVAGATPGKYFFKLRVISLTPNSKGKIQILQALLRSSLWAFEFLCLWIPYIAIFSQKDRRPVHDRASETMVITLKTQGDLGPHPLEAHLVRNLFFILLAVGLMWSSLFASQIYSMASRGEFKKAELEEEQALCPAITHYAEKVFSRQDLALARYIAGEVDEDCLLSEADFAIWTGEPTQEAWGYLAKSVYYQFDNEKSNTYLEKVCEQESGSEPCRLAQALKTEDRKAILQPSASLTAKLLQVRELSGRGDFAEALKKVNELTSAENMSKTLAGAFEDYAQKQTVKLLWMQGKREQASGAYMNSWQYMDTQDRNELASWMCLEEVDDSCDNRAYRACENLKDGLREASLSHASTEAIVGLVKEAECKKMHDLPLLMFHAELEENPSLGLLVSALSSSSEWGTERKLDALRHLSFSKDPSISKSVQKQARLALVSQSMHAKDLMKAAEVQSSIERHDWTWQKINKKILDVAQDEKNRSWAAPVLAELNKSAPHLRAPASEGKEEGGP